MLEKGESGGAEVAYVAPRTGMEEEVARVWAETFGVERVGVHENFFRLGGHSLLATQLVARLSDRLGVELPLRRLFESPTVAELVRVIEEQEAEGEKVRVPKMVRVSREQALPLSFAQQRLWFITSLNPDTLLTTYLWLFGWKANWRSLQCSAPSRKSSGVTRH